MRGFHERDRSAIAEEAALGEHGVLQVERVQDFYGKSLSLSVTRRGPVIRSARSEINGGASVVLNRPTT
jgi:hypothetical protein